MSDSQYSSNIQKIRSIIINWLENQLPNEKTEWLRSTGESLMNEAEAWKLFTSFSTVPRHTGKEKIKLTEADLKDAYSHRSGWNPSEWSVDQLGRTWLILCYAQHGKENFLDKLEKIFVTSDMGEAVALYQSLCIFPYPEELKLRAAEGVRSNITTVFNAVALNNPYPFDYLEQDPWNQIVLKALFVGSPLYKIVGLDKRANQTLARILVEYAHERRSAGREVSPELWRPVGPFINDEMVDDLKWVLSQTDNLQKQAGVLALRSSDCNEKNSLLKEYQEVAEEIDRENSSWDDIGKQYNTRNNI